MLLLRVDDMETFEAGEISLAHRSWPSLYMLVEGLKRRSAG
jgi:hypothetical protein